MRYQNPALQRHLATAYALGLLTRRARARLERLMADDPLLQERVDEQVARYAPLALALPPQAPSEALWTRVEQRLGFAAARPAPGSGWRRFFGGPRSREEVDSRAESRAGGGLARGVGWAFAGLAGGLVLGALIAPHGSSPSLSPAAALNAAQLPASYVGVLADEAGRAGMLVSSLRHGRIADIKLLQPEDVPDGSVLYLWGLPADGGTPIALGALPRGQSVRIELAEPSEKLLSGVTRLGVTLEAAGTSPRIPATPYRFLGFCGKFWR
ncbi:MAG: anti-sigma-K factor RskA [Candidatus Accumulibacter regalis]|jgi:anti-sigma-K factor RskA